MHRRDLLTSGLLAARAPWLYSRSLPLAVIVFMMTVLGCGIRDWERPVGRHGYSLMDPSGGIHLMSPRGEPVTPGEWKVARLIEDDDWLAIELRDAEESPSLPARWMVVDMAKRNVRFLETEAEARAVLPPNLQSRKFREPVPGGLPGTIRTAFFTLVILAGILLLVVLVGLCVRRSNTSRRVKPATASSPDNLM